jgi:hypothetical protein
MKNESKKSGEWIETFLGSLCWFVLLSAVAATFFKQSHPWLDTYARWVFGIFLAVPLIGIVGCVLFSIGFGIHRMWGLYNECMTYSKMGVVGRILWGFFFILSTIIGLCFIRL